MSLQDALNSQVDFGALAQLARRGLAWWRDELLAVLPPAWRDRLSARPRIWIEPKQGSGWRVWKDGRPVDEDTPDLWRDRVGLLAPAGAVLVREPAIARMSASDARRMLSLDIDRLSPLAPDLIHFDIEIVEEAGGAHRALLGILSRAEAARLLSRAKEDGLSPVALSARIDGREDRPRFDFLPQARAAEGETPRLKLSSYLWIGAGVLVAANLALLVARDMIDVSQLQAAVDAQRPTVDAVLRLRQRVEKEDARRRGLIAVGARNDPLRLIDTLSHIIPDGAWVQHLEWNGQTLHLVGFRHGDTDVDAALRASGAFAAATDAAADSATAPPPTAVSGSTKPFDVTVNVRTGGSP